MFHKNGLLALAEPVVCKEAKNRNNLNAFIIE